MTVKFVLINDESAGYAEATKVGIDDHGTSHNIIFEVVECISHLLLMKLFYTFNP